LKSCYQLILDVRTSAHHFRFCSKTEKTVCCASVPKDTESRPNSEADTTSSGKALVALICEVDPSIWTKLPTYLFSVFYCQITSRQSSPTALKSYLAQPLHSASIFLNLVAFPPRRLGHRSDHRCRWRGFYAYHQKPATPKTQKNVFSFKKVSHFL